VDDDKSVVRVAGVVNVRNQLKILPVDKQSSNKKVDKNTAPAKVEEDKK